ncbi:MAG: 30S ribosome-binding factor RbfA [candidate division NC10 bacterium]|nr:30S ribosome-binding factor RbfA [candidate division NC10 bacterium]
MPYSRAERVGDLIREELSELLLRVVKDPRVGMVTITGVTVSPDLRAARIYVISRAGGGVEDQTLDGLRAARGFLRGELGRRLRLKVIPALAFVSDPSLDHAMRIASLLRELHPAGKEPEDG